MLPGVSCLCTTYGRVKPLENAIQCYLDQRVQGVTELIILNDFPRQQLRIDHPEIKVINTKERCSSLAEKRNIIMEYVQFDTIATWGDDDVYLPYYLQSYLDVMVTTLRPYCGLGSMFFITGTEARGFTVTYKKYGPAGPFAMRTRDFHRAGGFAVGENVGEDQTLRKRAAASGCKVINTSKQATFGYRWDNDHYHISGLGFDRPDKRPSWDIIGENVNRLADQGKIPTGVIQLCPRYETDWAALCAKALALDPHLAALPQTPQ